MSMLADLSRRSTQDERMSSRALGPFQYARCLADLAKVNRLTRTHASTLRFLADSTRLWPSGARLTVLDVGSGQGDLLRAIAHWAKRRGFVAQLTGIDIDPESAPRAAAATRLGLPIVYLTGDVFAAPPPSPPDFIVCSQFAHHLSDAELPRFLGWLEQHAKNGWFIADLHRHLIPFYGFRLLAYAMLWHRVVREDGTISIARGFRRAEWDAMLRALNIPGRVSWHVPFRLCVARLK